MKTYAIVRTFLTGGLSALLFSGAVSAAGLPAQVDAVAAWPNGKIYVFSGGTYARIDSAARVVDRDSVAIAGNWPGVPFTRVDAVFVVNPQRACLFSGDRCLDYDIAADRADGAGTRPISAAWPGVSFKRIVGVVRGEGSKCYLFSETHYTRFDFKTNKADEGYPLKIADYWSGVGSDPVSAVVAWGAQVLFVRGKQALLFDMKTERTTGAAQPLERWLLGGSGVSGGLLFETAVKENGAEFAQKVRTIAAKLQIDPNWLMAMMYHESGLDHRIRNSIGAVGLIQFIPSTARLLGTTPEALTTMSNVEQLDYVAKYFVSNTGKYKRFTDLYLHGLSPVAVGKPEDYVVGSEQGAKAVSEIAKSNKPIDANSDGRITVSEFRRWAVQGFKPEVRRTLGE